MKKLITIAVISLMASMQAFAGEVACNDATNTRCAAYNLDVTADVLDAIQFSNAVALNLGRVTAGELVSVNSTGADQGRNKSFGSLEISFDGQRTEPMTITCYPLTSSVSFPSGESSTSANFASCDLNVQAEVTVDGATSWVSIMSGIDSYSFLAYEAFDKSELHVGGAITVPSDATAGAGTGSMRIEVVYE